MVQKQAMKEAIMIRIKAKILLAMEIEGWLARQITVLFVVTPLGFGHSFLNMCLAIFRYHFYP
jgi:hypothetical protein